MKRAGRLSRGEPFDSVYSRGTVISGPLLVVRFLPNDAGETRMGFAVGKRLSKKAVVRNRLKRQIREAVRLLPVSDGWDIVITARPKAMESGFETLRRDLETRFGRAGLLGSRE